MTTERDIDGPHAVLEDEALAWHVRLNSPEADEADWSAFEEWLSDPDAAQAYRVVEELWSALDGAPAEVRRLPQRAARGAPRWGVGVAASFALLALAGSGLLALWRAAPTKPSIAFEAPVDGTREVVLSDGSRLRLNRGAKVAVTMVGSQRQVALLSGEATFDVAHDSAHPFVVTAGDRQIRVVGTEFDVVRTPDAFRVTVRRGVIEVRPKGQALSTAPIARLTVGQTLSHDAPDAPDQVSEADPDAAFAWTTGRLVYVNAPLATVVADLQRYGSRRLTVDASVGRLPVTATLKIDTQDVMLRRLANFASVKVIRGTDEDRLSSQ